jgi:hypothetical protein
MALRVLSGLFIIFVMIMSAMTGLILAINNDGLMLGWFMGLVAGAQTTWLGLFLHKNKPVVRYQKAKRQPELLWAVEEEAEEDLYGDPNWWKDEDKVEKHKRNLYG